MGNLPSYEKRDTSFIKTNLWLRRISICFITCNQCSSRSQGPWSGEKRDLRTRLLYWNFWIRSEPLLRPSLFNLEGFIVTSSFVWDFMDENEVEVYEMRKKKEAKLYGQSFLPNKLVQLCIFRLFRSKTYQEMAHCSGSTFPAVFKCWLHKMYWSRKLSQVLREHLVWVILVFNQTRGKTRVWCFYSQVSQWRSCEFFCFVLYSLSEEKTGFAWTNIVLRQILTVFIKIIKLSTVFPNIPFAECGRYDFMFIFNIARKQVMGGDCAALYAYEEVQGKNNCMTTSWTAILLVKLSYSIIFSTEDRKQRDRKRYQSWKR